MEDKDKITFTLWDINLDGMSRNITTDTYSMNMSAKDGRKQTGRFVWPELQLTYAVYGHIPAVGRWLIRRLFGIRYESLE
jgi:hypothetical protein